MRLILTDASTSRASQAFLSCQLMPPGHSSMEICDPKTRSKKKKKK